MTDEVRKHIQQIRKLSPTLNQATDEANAVMAQVEKLLNEECSVGVPAEVHGETNERVGETELLVVEYYGLAYARVKGKYRLAVVEGEYLNDVQGDFVRDMRKDLYPWAECPRDMKLRTFRLLPKLLREIASEMASTIETVDGLKDLPAELIAALRAEPSSAETVNS